MGKVLAWVAGGVTAVAALVAVLAWAGGVGGVAYPQKVAIGGVRTDVAPLTSRWPLLGDPVEAWWRGGTLGDSRAPGPSTVWIDAVVTLEPEVVEAWVATYRLVPANDPPDLVEGVASHQPAGPLVRADELDAAFHRGDWSARVYLDPAQRQLVLVALRPP